jgi:type III secretory pathway lipoprotein EscJ
VSKAKVQLAVAGDVDEAKKMQALLSSAGIDAELEAAQDDALRVLVPEDDLIAAQEALEALTEPDELIAEP